MNSDTAATPPHKRNLAAKIIAVALVVAAAQLFWIIYSYAVDLPFMDHWDYLIALFENRGLADLFFHQHGPHRQGVGFFLTKVVASASNLNLRTEAFAMGCVLVVAALAALAWKRRLAGGLHWGDAIVPLLVLTPTQWEHFVVAPNPAHSVVPLLLLLMLGIAWTLRSPVLRYFSILLVHFCLLHTGFGMFGCPIVVLLLLLDARNADSHTWFVAGAAVVAAILIGTFFIGYRFEPATPDFAFPAPNWQEYPVLAARSVGSFFAMRGQAGLIAGSSLLVGSTLLAGFCLIRLWRNRARRMDRPVVLLSLFSLLFVSNVAVGRMSLGVEAGTASRYMTLLIPMFLALYLQLTELPWLARNAGIILLLGLLAFAHWPHPQRQQQMTSFYQQKLRWQESYLLHKDIAAADKAAGRSLHPNPEQTRLADKLRFLQSARVGFLR